MLQSLRRWVALISAVALGAAVLSLGAGSVLAAKSPKVTVCHLDKTLGTYSPITVSSKSSHPKEGDYLADLTLAGQTTYALAYTNFDGLPGYSVCDVMIAAFVEASGDTDFGAGDRVLYGHYPTALQAPYGFATFPWTSRTVDGTNCSASTLVATFGADPYFDHIGWEQRTDGSSDRLLLFSREPDLFLVLDDWIGTFLTDSIDRSGEDVSTIDLSLLRQTNDPFIDEQMNFSCPT